MHHQRLKITIFSFFIFCFAWATVVQAEPITQTITVKPGWNAGFLEVEPQDTDPSVVFAGLTDLVSVWRWNPNTGTVEFIQNPSLLVPEEPQYMVYLPGNPVLTNLHAIHGGIAYLVQMGGLAVQNFTAPNLESSPPTSSLAKLYSYVKRTRSCQLSTRAVLGAFRV